MVAMTNTTNDTAPADIPAQEEAALVPVVLEEVRGYALLDHFTALESVETWETPEAAADAARDLGGLPHQYGVKFRHQFRITPA